MRDDDEEQAEAALDLRIFFNSAGWSDVMGGQSSYIARWPIFTFPANNQTSAIIINSSSMPTFPDVLV